MGKKTLKPEGVPLPRGSYSHVAVAGDLVFIAGQGPSNTEGKVVGVGDVRTQTRETLKKIQTCVEAAGGSLRDLVSMTVFITDARYFNDVNEVRREFLGSDFPTSTMVVVAGLARPDMLIEINATAVVPGAAGD